jgi:hypothetical protein
LTQTEAIRIICDVGDNQETKITTAMNDKDIERPDDVGGDRAHHRKTNAIVSRLSAWRKVQREFMARARLAGPLPQMLRNVVPIHQRLEQL